MNVIFLTPIFQSNHFILCAGKHCLDPPIPDDKHNLILDTDYDKDSPREINEVITYYCNTEAVEGTTHWNRRLDNFGGSYNLRCQEKNTWDTPSWPTCAPSKYELSSYCHYLTELFSQLLNVSILTSWIFLQTSPQTFLKIRLFTMQIK